MRAKNSGTRRNVNKALAEKQTAPRGRPPKRHSSEYENQPVRFPGRHVAIAPLDAPRDIDAPTVETLIADGYTLHDAVEGFPVPAGHALVSIDAEEFGRRHERMIAEANALLNPDGQPQSEEEMKAVIQNKMTPGQFGAAGRADRIRTAAPVSLSQAEAQLAVSQRDPGTPLETNYFNDVE